MKRFLSLIALGAIGLAAGDATAQVRDFGTQRLILDNNLGTGSATLQYTGVGHVVVTFPPFPSTTVAFGTVNGQTLAWDHPNSEWDLMNNWMNDGSTLAATSPITMNNIGGGNVTTFNEDGITRSVNGAFNLFTGPSANASTLNVNGPLHVTANGRPTAPTPGIMLGIDGATSAGIEIVTPSNTGTAYLDFTRNVGTDADARLALTADDNLMLAGANLDMNNNHVLNVTNLATNGTVTHTILSANLPVKTNASDQLVSGAINLASAEVTGILPVANGGTGVNATSIPGNQVFASPNGGPGAPTFRALVAADVPAGSGFYIQNGVAPQTADYNITGNGTVGGNLTVGDGSATGIIVNTAGTNDLTIAETGITRSGNIAINGGAANQVTSNSELNVNRTLTSSGNAVTATAIGSGANTATAFRANASGSTAANVGLDVVATNSGGGGAVYGVNLAITGPGASEPRGYYADVSGGTTNLGAHFIATGGTNATALRVVASGAGTNRAIEATGGIDNNSGGITEAGAISGATTVDASTGYRIGGTAVAGNYLRGDGANFVSSAIQVADIPTAMATDAEVTAAVNTAVNGTAGRLAVFTAANAVGNGNLSGDVTTAGGTVTTIANDAVTSAKILNNEITNADINAAAAIVDTKLATIATAGKVSNSATTATSANNPNTIVLRDGSGNFSAGTISATFSGDGSALTNLEAGDISSGILGVARGGTGLGTVGANGEVLTVVAGVPQWAPAGGGAVTSVSNTDGNITVSPNTGAVVVELAATIDANTTGDAGSVDGIQGANIITNSTSAGGDLTGTYPSPTVASVGGEAAIDIAAASQAVGFATSTASFNTLVERDGSGNFSANQISADLIGNVTGNVTGDVTGDAGTVDGIEGANIITNSTAATGDLTGTYPGPAVATVGGVTAASIATGVNLANGSTSSNLANTIVRRDASGGFLADDINANSFIGGTYSGNGNGLTNLDGADVVGNIPGNAAGFTGSLSGNVTGTQGATTVVAVQNAAGASIVTAINSQAGQIAAANTQNLENLNGTLDVASGGTGLTTVTANGLLIGNGASAMTALAPGATAGHVLTSNGTGSAPSWQAAPSGGASLSVQNDWTQRQDFEQGIQVGTSANVATIAAISGNSGSLDFPNAPNNSSQALTLTVAGAADGDPVMLGVPNALTGNGRLFQAWVSAADTVTVQFTNTSGAPLNLGAGTFKVAIMKF